MLCACFGPGALLCHAPMGLRCGQLLSPPPEMPPVCARPVFRAAGFAAVLLQPRSASMSRSDGPAPRPAAQPSAGNAAGLRPACFPGCGLCCCPASAPERFYVTLQWACAAAHCTPLRKKHLWPAAKLLFWLRGLLCACSGPGALLFLTSYRRPRRCSRRPPRWGRCRSCRSCRRSRRCRSCSRRLRAGRPGDWPADTSSQPQDRTPCWPPR